jgi:hypothetical protein
MTMPRMLDASNADLETLGAIRIWLSGLYELGDEAGLITAIQRDRRIDLDDDEIAYVLADAARDGMAAEMTLDRLLQTAAGATWELSRSPR